MARLNDLKMSTAERRRRRFSDNFKMQKVREIETRQTKVSEICSQYQVTSKNVYLWVDKFGSMKNKKERMVGQKQIVIDFQYKMIELETVNK